LRLTLDSLRAHEILDSRGKPTVSVRAVLSDGTHGDAHVPSGASTGKHEALELRDGNPLRYGGAGVLGAVEHVNGPIQALLKGAAAHDIPSIDAAMITADGTPNKSRFGANAILGVSCAVSKAVAASERQPLWRFLAETFSPRREPTIPVPMVNILSGGLHAGQNIEFQDFLVMAPGYETYADALEAIVRLHGAARAVIAEKGIALTGVADEGGWGPALSGNVEALSIVTEAISRAGQIPVKQMGIAIDVASSHFYRDGQYHLKSEGKVLAAVQMVELLAEWCAQFPLISIEDALEEDDWTGWQELTRTLGHSIQLVGDDFFTTNPERLSKGIAQGAANAVLVKMNQIGSLSETFQVLDLAHSNGYECVVSARSGETEDSFLADLAVASGAGQIKVGSITRSERLAKYNRLLEIERFEGPRYFRMPTRVS
jgi:enolase